MPDTQPSREAARKENEAGYFVERPDTTAAATKAALKLFGALYRIGPEVAMDDEKSWVPVIAAALDAYAFAKLEAAEGERDRIAAESLAAIVGRQRAEERVRVLEAALRSIIDHEGRPCIANGCTGSRDFALDALNAKAAAAEGGKG